MLDLYTDFLGRYALILLKLRIVVGACAIASFALTGCGADESDEKDGAEKEDGDGDGDGGDGTDTVNPPGSGWIVDLSTGSAEVKFEGAVKGAKYALLPHSLGEATVKAAPDAAVSTTFSFSAGNKGNSGDSLKMRMDPPTGDHTMSIFDYEHSMRVLASSYDRSKGSAQTESYWRLAQRLDRVTELLVPNGFGMDVVAPSGELMTELRRQAQSASSGSFAGARSKEQDRSFLLSDSKTSPKIAATTLTQEDDCPTDEVVRPFEDLSIDSAEIDDATTQVDDQTSYCLIYLADPVTETDKTKIVASLKTIMDTYYTLYGEKFTKTVVGYAFRPQIVIADFSDTDDAWPAGVKKTAGVYLSSMIDVDDNGSGNPMIYMAHDLSKVEGLASLDKTAANRFWHATLAHEMQHAIFDYYVQTTEGSGEIPAIDEGIAHYMEDAFGYGVDIFDQRAKTFFLGFGFGTKAFLSATSDPGDVDRGVAHALMYYASAQKGGVTFKDGLPTAADGMAWVVKHVKDRTAQGGPGLASTSGIDRGKLFGNFLGALALDGRSLGKSHKVADEFSTGEPVTGVKDLNGNEDGVFGMQFNGYQGTTDWSADDDVETFTSASKTPIELNRYTTKPVLYTVSDPDQTIKITADVTEGTAVTVVRLK